MATGAYAYDPHGSVSAGAQRARVLGFEFEPAPYVLSSVLTFRDMTTSPDGELVPVERRLAEIHHRYGSIGMLEDILGLSMDDCDAVMEERAMPRPDPRYRRVWRSAGVYSSAVVDGPVLVPPPASSTLPSGSRKVWPPLLSRSVLASRDQVFVAGW